MGAVGAPWHAGPVTLATDQRDAGSAVRGRDDGRHVAHEERAFAERDWALLVAIAAMWGSSFLWIELGLERFPPQLVALLRVVFGIATLAVVPGARRALPPAAWPRVAVLGVVWMAGPFLLFPLAQQWIDSSLAGMLNAAQPLFAALVAALLARRLPRALQAAGLALGFGGVVVLSAPAIGGASATALGAGLILLATVLYGVAVNLAAPLQRAHGALPVVLRAQIVAAAVLLPFGGASVPSARFAWGSLIAVAVLGAFSSGLALVAMTTLVGRVGAARGSIAIYFLPVVAIALGVLVRGEAVTLWAIAGTALIVVGAYLTSRGARPGAPEAAQVPASAVSAPAASSARPS